MGMSYLIEHMFYYGGFLTIPSYVVLVERF